MPDKGWPAMAGHASGGDIYTKKKCLRLFLEQDFLSLFVVLQV